jgi:hypothetical protein
MCTGCGGRREDRAGTDQATVVRQLDGVADEFGAHVCGHGVPGDLPVEQVDRGGQIQPALAGGQVGDVADEPQTGRGGGEVARTRSGTGTAALSCRVSDRRRRRVIPAMPRSRMIRSTRLRLTGRPWRRSSAVTRGDP